MTEPRRPEVVLVRSSLAPPDQLPERAAPSTHRWGSLTASALVLLLAGTAPVPADRSPAPEVSALLLARPDGLTVSQSGVLVLPLELRNSGSALQVTTARAYAEPVVDDAVVQAPGEVTAWGQRRFVALVAPDCRLLRQGSPISFRGTVLLRVETAAARKDLVLDLADVPGVRDLVAGLCG